MIRKIDVLVLGGGYGKRLFAELDLPKYTPKGLIPIEGTTGLDMGLRTFSKSLIGKIIIETNREGALAYSDWIDRHKEYDSQLFIEPRSSPTSCLGVLETLEYFYQELKPEKPILLMAPDNIFFQNQDHLILNSEIADVKVLTYNLSKLSEVSKYGALVTEGNKIVECEEKPAEPKSRLIKTAYEIWKPSIFEGLNEWNKEGDSDKVGEYLNHMIQKKFKIISIPTKGEWIDIGAKKDFIKAKTKI